MEKNDQQSDKMDVDEKTEENTSKTSEKKDESEDKKKDVCKHQVTENLLEDHHEGTVVCSKCGVVVVEQLICGISELRSFADDTLADRWKRSRCGDAANHFLSSGANLATTIRSAEGGGSGGGANSFNASILKSIKRKSVDNGIYHGLRRLDEMADRIHLPQSVLEYSQYLYYKMYKRGKFKGIALQTDGKVGACLYIACYHGKCPRTINEICGISEHGHEAIRRNIQRITKLLNLPVGPIECSAVLPRYCAWLELPHEVEREASRIAHELNERVKRHDFSIETLSGAAIYCVLQQPDTPEKYQRTIQEICESLGIESKDLFSCYQFYRRQLSLD